MRSADCQVSLSEGGAGALSEERRESIEGGFNGRHGVRVNVEEDVQDQKGDSKAFKASLTRCQAMLLWRRSSERAV